VALNTITLNLNLHHSLQILSSLSLSFIGCPNGNTMKCCDVDLCLHEICPKQPTAVCRANACDDCAIEFYDEMNRKVDSCYEGKWIKNWLINVRPPVLERKIWIYWSKSNSWIYFLKLKLLLVLGRRTSAHCENRDTLKGKWHCFYHVTGYDAVFLEDNWQDLTYNELYNRIVACIVVSWKTMPKLCVFVSTNHKNYIAGAD